MKLKLDENLPSALAADLSGLGHDVDTVMDEHLAGCSDAEVWAGTEVAGPFLITQDLDFSDARKYPPGTHNGLLVVRISEPSRARLVARVMAVFSRENVTSWAGCLVIATDQKVRVRRP